MMRIIEPEALSRRWDFTDEALPHLTVGEQIVHGGSVEV
jgi:hypothetical protein